MPDRQILIVDDEPQNLAALREVLENYYPLAFANGGEKGVELARTLKPSLILLDIEMPGLNGFEVCKLLKADALTENIPVLFVTSKSDAVNEAAGFDCGAVDFIQKPIIPAVVLARVSTHLSLVRASKLEKSYHEAISMLGTAGHYNDNDTGVHIWRMAAYARAISRAFGWSEIESQQLEAAAPMHDTGKIGIPAEILKKPGKLNPQEWQVMQTHTSIGYEILSKSNAPVFQMAAKVALRHHEKWDGSGYPDGLAGLNIPESARIVALADVFDALTMQRPYKKEWSVEAARAEIRKNTGIHFEPRMVDCFDSIFSELIEIKARWQEEQPRYKMAMAMA
ncbi:MAG: response regulator [Gammaproteobacteria bacterium]|jgi:putative two-component system response regulator